jgi:hypothetical protein
MQKAANILREETPDDFLLIPSGKKIARMLEDAAKQYRDYVAVSWSSAGVVKWTRQSRLTDIFASGLSNILRNLTGKWLDHEVAVLTQIAFDDPDFDNDQVIWIRRGVERGGANQKPAD